MLLIFDPLYIMLGVLGYFIMFLLASTVAPKIAGRFAGKFSLYTSMAILGVMILGISALIIYLVLSFAGYYFSLLGIVIFVLIVNLLMYLVSPYIINMSYSAKPSPELQRVVDTVANRLGVKPPKAVIVRGPPNAFAYGNFLTGKFVAVTDSMLKMLSKEELEAVIGHEIGHHKHRDNAVMLLFGLLPSIIFYLGYMLIHSSLSERRNQLALLGFAAVIASFLVQILVLAFSRLREYYADFEGALAAGKRSMQYALAKIHAFYHRYPDYHEMIASDKFRTLFIYAFVQAVASPYVAYIDVESIKRAKVNPVEEFLSTHPPIPKRLRFLDSLPL